MELNRDNKTLKPLNTWMYVSQAVNYELDDSNEIENQYSDISFWLQRNWLFWRHDRNYLAIDYWSKQYV